MPATPIETSDLQVYRHPKADVYFSPVLKEQDFALQPFVRCEQLRITAAPEIDQCQLSYDFGTVKQIESSALTPSAYTPLYGVGGYVKVVITDTVHEDDPEATDNSITWYGLIEYDERQLNGNGSGRQYFTAFGLGRLADKVVVKTSKVDVDGTELNSLQSRSGLTFNLDSGGQFVRRGNRSTNKLKDAADADTTYAFSWEPRGFSEWSAYTAVQYLLANHSPPTSDGTPANVWRLDSEEDYLDWYEITEPTDGRTLKQLLDALIPRYRAVGYWIDLDTSLTDPEDPESFKNEVVVHVFTTVGTDISLPNSHTLKANVNQRTLDIANAFDIQNATTSYVTTQSYHEIIARGARRTTTFTARVSDLDAWGVAAILGPSWTSDDQTEYINGASTATDYSSLTPQQKQARNAVARTSDRLREVFRRFVMNTQKGASTWNCQILEPHKLLDSGVWWLRGDQSTDPFDAAVPTDFDPATDYVGSDYVPGLRIMRGLPLYERKDYSGTNLADFSYGASFTDETHPSFIPLLAYARTSTGSGDVLEISPGEIPHRYEMLDRLHQKRFDTTSNRDWSCRVHVVDTEPGIELVADTPHFIAKSTEASTPYASTAVEQIATLHGGIDYTDIWVTMCVELTEHAEQKVVLTAPAAGLAVNSLIIPVPDARHDYVIPYTTVEIKDGLPVPTTSGGAAKNDLTRLKSIATAAAEWYSVARQTLDLQWKQVRGTFQLGWLITELNGSPINTPITAIVYNLGGEHQPGGTSSGFTKLETSFTNLDFS